MILSLRSADDLARPSPNASQGVPRSARRDKHRLVDPGSDYDILYYVLTDTNGPLDDTGILLIYEYRVLLLHPEEDVDQGDCLDPYLFREELPALGAHI